MPLSPPPMLTPPPPRVRETSDEPISSSQLQRSCSDAGLCSSSSAVAQAHIFTQLPPTFQQHALSRSATQQQQLTRVRSDDKQQEAGAMELGPLLTSDHSSSSASTQLPPAAAPTVAAQLDPSSQLTQRSPPSAVPALRAAVAKLASPRSTCALSSGTVTNHRRGPAAVVRAARRLTWCHLLLLWQCLWVLCLFGLLVFMLHPLQLKLADTRRMLDAAIARAPLMQRHTFTEFTPARLSEAFATEEEQAPSPEEAASEPAAEPAETAPAPSYLFPTAQAARLTGATTSRSTNAASSIFNASATSSTDFDVFSAEHLATQYIVMYRSDDPALSLGGPQAIHNLTQSLLAPHADYLYLVAEFDALPGFACAVSIEGLDAEDSYGPRTFLGSGSRRHTLLSVLDSLRAHPSVLFISQDRPMTISTAGQALHSGAVQTPGPRRIQSASRSTVSQAAMVGVAVMDTGIDLHHPALNSKQGINCIHLLETYVKKYRSRDGDSDGGDSEGESSSRHRSRSSSPLSSSSVYQAPMDETDENVPAQDDNNHGTHVAGIIGALNKQGVVVGVAPGTPVCPSTRAQHNKRTGKTRFQFNKLTCLICCPHLRSDAVKILNAGGQGSWAHLLCGISWSTKKRLASACKTS